MFHGNYNNGKKIWQLTYKQESAVILGTDKTRQQKVKDFSDK
jgi:hypothetical protein